MDATISESELLFDEINVSEIRSKEFSKRFADVISQKYPHLAPEVVKIFLRTRIFHSIALPQHEAEEREQRHHRSENHASALLRLTERFDEQ